MSRQADILPVVAKRKWWYWSSIIILAVGITGFILGDARLGIDFTGGSLLELTADKPIDTKAIEAVYQKNSVELNRVTPVGERGVLIRSKPVDQAKKQVIIQDLKDKAGDKINEEQFETIGPTVSADLVNKAILSIIGASAAIVLYLAYSFRKATRVLGWRFGITAIITLLHDVATTAGIYALISRFTGYEIDTLFVTALLTVMSFSVHDTIVVFDRIREHISDNPGAELSEIVDLSITSTLGRSLSTSLTIIIVLLALFMLGGTTIRGFVLTLLVGMSIGTYSSIFIASPLLVSWQWWAQRRWQKLARKKAAKKNK